jgi:type I restriction enzyme S subunit
VKHRAYPKYKNSSIQWVGDIPDGWAIDRLKGSIKSCNNGIWGSDPTGDDDTICIRVADFNRDNLSINIANPTIRNISEKEKKSRTLKKGDLLIEKSGGGENQPVGCVVLYEHDIPAVCSNFVAKMTLKDGMAPSFWKYLHSAAYSIRLTTGSINQTSGIQNLDQDRYFDEKVAFPPSEEQIQIASFLDKETLKIDALINKQKQLIALLLESRMAKISNAVTLGIDKHTKTRSTDIPWLPEIPVHWELKKIKQTSYLKGRVGWKGLSSDEYLESGYAYLVTGTDFKKKYIDWKNCHYVAEARYMDDPFIQLRENDLLITKDGTIGKLALVKDLDRPACLNSGIFLLRPENSYTTDFMYWILSSSIFNRFCDLSSMGSTIQHLYQNVFEEFTAGFPSIKEQQLIVEYLEATTSKIDNLIAKSKHSIQLLTEYRTSLIFEAVTGKIDTRKLPSQ